MRFLHHLLTVSVLALGGCTPAQLVFGDVRSADGLTFYDPAPHLLVTVAGDCTVTSQIVAIPGRARSVRLKPGHGSADLSLGFNNGLITSVGQKSDTKVPETITAIGGLAGLIGGIFKAQVAPVAGAGAAVAPTTKTCPPQAKLFAIDDGKISSINKLEEVTLKQNP